MLELIGNNYKLLIYFSYSELIGGIKGTISSRIFEMSIDSNNVNNNIYYICYQIDKDRYRHTIGRHHKSNRIMYEVNLVTRTIIQRL